MLNVCPDKLTNNQLAMPAAFPKISKIQYEGPQSKDPLAFKHDSPDELVEGKPMKDHLRFSVTYWHTFRGMLSDMFGVGTAIRPWDDGTHSVANAQRRHRRSANLSQRGGADARKVCLLSSATMSASHPHVAKRLCYKPVTDRMD